MRYLSCHDASGHARGQDQAVATRGTRRSRRGHHHRTQRHTGRPPRPHRADELVGRDPRRAPRPRAPRRGLRRAARRHRRGVRRELRLLLDTHPALWFLSGDERLSESAKQHLIDDTNRVLLSAAVVWEVAIKSSLGKLVVPEEYVSLLLDA